MSLWACILCALIVTAAVDPSPDPPALNQDRQESQMSSAGATVPALPGVSTGLHIAPGLAPVRWLFWLENLETKHPVTQAGLVRSASDTSPPPVPAPAA